MKGFVYIVENAVTKRKYIGKKYYYDKNGHETDWEEYLGSSVELRADIEKYGKQNFTRAILSEHKSEQDLAKAEQRTIREHNAVFDPTYYNKSDGGKQFFTTPESINKGIQTRKSWSPNKKAQVQQNLRDRFLLTQPNEEVRRRKISQAHKGNPEFKQMRKRVQKETWNKLSKDQKEAINKKRSQSVTDTWNNRSLKEKEEHSQVRKNWHASLSPEEKEAWKQKIRDGRKKSKHI